MSSQYNPDAGRRRLAAGPDYAHEKAAVERHGGPCCGVDEAGRGPWAGPVAAAAVILDPANIPAGLDDSKKISESRRERLFDDIIAAAQVGVAFVEVEEIDRLNILAASMKAMQMAIAALPVPPACAIIDGNRLPELDIPARPLIKGDQLALSIAAASIIAKVSRDLHMRELGRLFPQYGFERHKGYGTRQHRQALEQYGVTIHHRRSFRPVSKILARKAGREGS